MASEWRSGCESGWTDYLNDSFHSPNQYQATVYDIGRSVRVSHEDEEDLSMVSDASSGPPHFCYEQEDEDFQKGGFSGSFSKEQFKGGKAKESRGKHQSSYLDDTASSPAFNCTKSYVDSSNNQVSISHETKQGNSAFSKQFGFWQSSHPKRLDSAEPSACCGRRRRRRG